jgi:hypothetical protein
VLAELASYLPEEQKDGVVQEAWMLYRQLIRQETELRD